MKKYERFSQILTDMAAEKPDVPAIICGDASYTYAQLKDAVDLFANDLVKAGLQPGDHVALWAFSCANWPIAYLGIVRAGGVAVLTNYGLVSTDILSLLQFADVKYLVYGDTRDTLVDPNAVQKLLANLGLPAACALDIRQDFLSRIAAGESADMLPPENTDSRRTATIIFTSGTTAAPKAVQQSQLAACCNVYSSYERIKTRIGTCVALALPLFHSYGLEILLFYLGMGATVCLAEQLKPDCLVDTIVKNQATDVYSVSALYLGMINHPRFAAEVANVPRLCTVGGGYSAPEQILGFQRAFPNARFTCGYGQTESCTVISVTSPEDTLERRANTVGKPLSCFTLRIMDKNGNWAPAGTSGEVVYKGDSVMNGYYKLPAEQQAIDADGWLHSGDLGYLDQDGFLHIVGRIKDIIIKSGENIVPSEIEAKIMSCGGVRAVKVLGAPHPVTGESIEACIIPEPGKWENEEVLRQQLKGKLNSFMMPSHFFLYDQFPLNENGKLDQRTLQENMIRRLVVISSMKK